MSEGEARAAELPVSLCAVLLAEACNIGLEPVVRSDVAALTRGRLTWVQQNYIRADTLTQANANLVDTQSTIALAQEWGGGEVASADGLRFVVPIRTLNAGPNPKYYGAHRGVTYYNFSSDQFMGFHGIVIPGTLRDSMYILDGLLEHQTRLRPVEVMADTAGVSDVVFGLFWLLGYQFSPRLADIGEARFWRLDPTAATVPAASSAVDGRNSSDLSSLSVGASLGASGFGPTTVSKPWSGAGVVCFGFTSKLLRGGLCRADGRKTSTGTGISGGDTSFSKTTIHRA